MTQPFRIADSEKCTSCKTATISTDDRISEPCESLSGIMLSITAVTASISLAYYATDQVVAQFRIRSAFDLMRALGIPLHACW